MVSAVILFLRMKGALALFLHANLTLARKFFNKHFFKQDSFFPAQVECYLIFIT
jgi:hypothetical protein